MESVQYQFLVIDAVDFLRGYPFNGSEFVYADPPYVRSARRSVRPIYRFEYTDDDHVRLLDVLTKYNHRDFWGLNRQKRAKLARNRMFNPTEFA